MNTDHSQRKMTFHRRAWTLAGSFLFAIGGFISAQAQEPEAETPVKSESRSHAPVLAGEERDMKLLAAQLPEESAVWLNSSSENFLSIYEPDRTGSPFGVLLIIHDEGQHANWPHNIEAIRNTMPEYGWGSLTLSLPLPDYPGLPAREADVVAEAASQEEPANSSKEPKSETDSKPADESKDIYNAETGKVDNIDQATSTKEPEKEEAPQTPPKAPAEDRAQERITAAIRWLNEQGQYNIAILGDGIGAIRASNFIAQVNEENAASGNINIIRGMVMLSPKHSVPSGETSLMTFFKQAPMPTLDIYFGYQQHTLRAAQKRLHMARRAKFPQYQQLHLPETVSLPTVNRFNTGNRQVGANRLTQRIRGFLQKHARGVAVDNALIQGRQ